MALGVGACSYALTPGLKPRTVEGGQVSAYEIFVHEMAIDLHFGTATQCPMGAK